MWLNIPEGSLMNNIKSSINQKNKKRLVFLDAAKGIAILFVVAGHLIKMKPSIIDHGSELANLIYAFHMPVFFVISGMGLYLSLGTVQITLQNLIERCKKYTKRLLLCYFVWSLISYFLSSINHKLNTEEWFWSIITFRGRAPIWFLGALFWGEIVFLLFNYFVKNKKTGLIIALIFSAIMTVLCSNLMQSISDIKNVPVKYIAISLSRFFPVFFFLCIGFVIMKILQENSFSDILYLITGFAMALLMLLVQIVSDNQVNLHLFKLGNPFIFILNGTLGSLAIVLICKALSSRISFKLLSKIGNNSLGIMLIHYTPFPTMAQSWSLCTYFSFLPGAFIYILAVIIATAISYLATILINRKLLI